MPLTADELFTPEQSGVSTDVSATPDTGTWFASLLSTATALGLPTTAWQSGGPERTILACAAVALNQEDVIVSLMAQGGFLDYAASGTVSTTNLDGSVTVTPVTPDPSIPSQNPTGALGWLDALGSSFFDEDRLLASFASGQLAIVNTSASTVTEAVGGYHAANTINGATYTNTVALSVPPSAIAGSGGVITGVTIGTVTTIQTSAAHGLAISDVVYLTGIVGVTGLNGVFAAVTAVPTSTTFTVAVLSAGAWASAGTVYKCTIAQMASDARGIDGNASVGQVTTTITQFTGVSCYNLTSWSASNYESNTAYAARCRLKLGSLSPDGPASAYDYYALTAYTILADQSPPVGMTNGPIAKSITYSTPATQITTTVVSSSTPASSTLGGAVTPGCAQLSITAATNTTPIAITTSSAHGLSTGDAVIVSGALGNLAANGAFTATVTGASTFTLDGSVGSGAWTGSGSVEGGDLGQVDALIQANVVPDGITATTESSLAFPITVVAVVAVPQAYASIYAAAAITELQTLFASYPIGGNIPDGESAGTVPYSAVEGALFTAAQLTLASVSYVRQVSSLTVNGGIVDLTYPSPNHDAQLGTPTITVVGV